jgi:hypothetical protein
MRKGARAAALVAVCLALAGCAFMLPAYEASYENVRAAKEGGAPLKLGAVTLAKGVGNPGLRTWTYRSPVGKDHAALLHAALRDELGRAGRLDDGAARVLSATVLHNDMAEKGGIATATLEVEFVLVDVQGERFRKRLTATHSWDSPFIGALASGNALASYPTVVSKLLGQLFADPGFRTASS